MEFILSFMSIIAYTLLVSSLRVSIAVDTSIAQSRFIKDGMTIVSPGGIFELGFFNLTNPNKRYLGIWYKNIPVQNVVWVANGGKPINDSSAILKLDSSGNLVLTHKNTVVWCTSPSSLKKPKNPVAELLDSGNLVIRDENEANREAYLWQSFDYPSNTMLAKMKLGWDLRRGLNRRLIAWKSADDPAPGDFYWSVERHQYPDIYMKKGVKKLHRIGPWNGLRFSGMPEMKDNPIFNYEFVSNKDEAYYTWSLHNPTLISKVVLNQTNIDRPRYVWSETDKLWRTYSTLPVDYCDTYGLCGSNAYCSITASPVCECLKGFKPKSPEKWNSMDWSQGCVRNYPLSCKDKLNDGFVHLAGLKVPDTEHTLVNVTIGLEECRAKCLNNCSCMAYTNSDIRGAGSGCVMWLDELIDIKQFPLGGQDLYIRMPASELEAEYGRKKNMKIIAVSTIAAVSGMLSLAFYSLYKVRRNNTEKSKSEDNHERYLDDLDLPLLDLPTIKTSANNFSVKNKIGEGGFGPVYKGKLADGQEIAVKRLSKSSGQGMYEFINEVKLIAKLQHRNLVKLLGCCIQGQEKMLVYEYMANRSLDYFIFDRTKGKLLEWPKRFQIICEIARGLVYLHQDSRLRIIHRDLKASNILLDDTLNPKISDFGMARIFGGEQIEENTNRIVGTYGYMAPEYAVDGLFSIKSDVFSFGILLLEIICGRKNRGRYRGKQTLNLVGHAWTLWKVGKALQIIDSNIEDSCIVSEALRCIHVSLLCVQQYPEDRPTMSSVVLMLGSEMELDEPKEPGFFTRKKSIEANSSSSSKDMNSNNEITITLLSAR